MTNKNLSKKNKKSNEETNMSKSNKKTEEKITLKDVLNIILPQQKTYTKDKVIVVVETKLGKKKMDISSEDYKNYLGRTVFDTYGAYPAKTTISNAVNYVMAMRFDYVGNDACYRVKSDNEHIYYDLNNNNLEYVEISSEGWSVKNDDNNYFLTSPFAVEQATPVDGNIDILRKYINLSDGDWLLYKVYLISCFYSKLPHPIINFMGEKGTCKSTLSEMLKRLIDPSQQNLGEFSTKQDDFKLRLSSEYFVVADNLRKINSSTSDLLCRVVTGGNMTRRKLYPLQGVRRKGLFKLYFSRRELIMGTVIEIANAVLEVFIVLLFFRQTLQIRKQNEAVSACIIIGVSAIHTARSFFPIPTYANLAITFVLWSIFFVFLFDDSLIRKIVMMLMAKL